MTAKTIEEIQRTIRTNFIENTKVIQVREYLSVLRAIKCNVHRFQNYGKSLYLSDTCTAQLGLCGMIRSLEGIGSANNRKALGLPPITVCRVLVLWDYLRIKQFRRWPEFSGINCYPVQRTARGGFDHFSGHGEMWVGEYGSARIRLLNFMIRDTEALLALLTGGDDGRMVEVDYSQLEVVIQGMLSRDPQPT